MTGNLFYLLCWTRIWGLRAGRWTCREGWELATSRLTLTSASWKLDCPLVLQGDERFNPVVREDVGEEWAKEGWDSELQIRVGPGSTQSRKMALFAGVQFICGPKMRRSWKGWGTGRQGRKECKQCWECQLSPGRWGQWKRQQRVSKEHLPSLASGPHQNILSDAMDTQGPGLLWLSGPYQDHKVSKKWHYKGKESLLRAGWASSIPSFPTQEGGGGASEPIAIYFTRC